MKNFSEAKTITNLVNALDDTLAMIEKEAEAKRQKAIDETFEVVRHAVNGWTTGDFTDYLEYAENEGLLDNRKIVPMVATCVADVGDVTERGKNNLLGFADHLIKKSIISDVLDDLSSAFEDESDDESDEEENTTEDSEV